MKLLDLSPGLAGEISNETLALCGSVVVAPLEKSTTFQPGPIVFVEEQLEPSDVVYQSIQKKCHFLLQKNPGYFNRDLLATASLAEKPQVYFHDQFQFSPESCQARETILFEKSSDKPNLKRKALALIHSLNSPSLTDAANAIVEELYMNALFDAPREAEKHKVPGRESKPARPCQMELIQTEKFLQISCSDYYGSLDVSSFLHRMNDVYRNGAGPMMNMEANRGAGLGCIILFEHSSCVILGVKPGQQTKVTCLIPIGISNLRRTQMKKSLHWFHGSEV